ncbi:MAG: hypothetical protein NWF09_08970 [Candidatus Bathyarchaeota archaeon]|nr:hypothetical protein [Candidatus Bathyarchaeota archaeon]
MQETLATLLLITVTVILLSAVAVYAIDICQKALNNELSVNDAVNDLLTKIPGYTQTNQTEPLNQTAVDDALP